VIIIDKHSNAPTLTNYLEISQNQMSLTNYALHQSSFRETYTERALNVSRPQLNDTNLDPDVYLNEVSYLDVSRLKDNSILLKAWADQYSIDDKSIN